MYKTLCMFLAFLPLVPLLASLEIDVALGGKGKPERWLPDMISGCGHQASLLRMQAKHHTTIIPLGTQLEHLQWPHAASGRLTGYGLGGLGMPPCQLASGHAAPGIAHLPPKVNTCCSRPCADLQDQERGDTRRRCTQDMSRTIILVLPAASSYVWMVSG